MKARILHVVYSLEPGGMENGVVNMANKLDPCHYELGVLFLEKEGGMAGRLPHSTGKFVLMKKPGLDLGVLPSFIDALEGFRPDIVHTHNLGPLIYTALARGMARVRFQLVHGEHASLTQVDLSPKKRLQRSFLYSACQAIHTVGHHMTVELENGHLSRQPVHTLANGVDASRFCPSADGSSLKESLLGVSPGSPVLALVGRFGSYKGHKALLEAFIKIGKEHTDCLLLFVGGGGEMEEGIKGIARDHPHSGRIRFTGFQEDPLPFYQLADLLVVPSENEGLSNSILEAMACGTPVLTNNSCGATELVRDGINGFVNPTNDPGGLAASILQILGRSHKELDSISVASREFVCRYYSLEAMAAGYSVVYSRFSEIGDGVGRNCG